MRTTKAYLAGLGTTGVLIAAILLLLSLGSGVVAFDSLSDWGGQARLDRVVVERGASGAGAKAQRARGRQGTAADTLAPPAGRHAPWQPAAPATVRVQPKRTPASHPRQEAPDRDVLGGGAPAMPDPGEPASTGAGAVAATAGEGGGTPAGVWRSAESGDRPPALPR